MQTKPVLTLGAVTYDPKVITIWEGFKQYFLERELPFDFVLYSNYERQVEGLFAGECQVAWNSPLAWIEAERLAEVRGLHARALAMRDTDRDLRSVIVTRANGPVASLMDLKGRTVGVGATDSPQATLIPLLHLLEAGLQPDKDVRVRRFDVLLGKHGDHIGGERDAARALMAGEVDAVCVMDANHLLFSRDGTWHADQTRILAQTEPYDHCNFTVLDSLPTQLQGQFTELLLSMRYEDAAVRPLFDLEGLKTWLPARTSGYVQLERAVDRLGTLQDWLHRQQPPR